MIPQHDFDLLATDCIFKGIEQSFLIHYVIQFFTIDKKFLNPEAVAPEAATGVIL